MIIVLLLAHVATAGTRVDHAHRACGSRCEGTKKDQELFLI